MGTTTIADSIGIAVWKDDGALLTSIGNELHMHLPKDEQLKSSTCGEVSTKLKPRLIDSKVHGIVVGTCQNKDKVIVYGGEEFMILAWCDTKHEFIVLHRAQLTDWINGALFLQDNDGEFILHTSHSVVIRYNYRNLEDNYEIVMNEYEIWESASCEDKSTLYTSHLHGSKWEEVIVFSGNAMGELLIWQPSHRSALDGSIPLLRRIAAHNGVVFSIDYNAHNSLLTTTSDDRSIKFWRVNVGKTHASESDWSSVSLQPFVVGYGHSARVFCGKIIEYNEQPYAITVGEDSYFCLWNGNGELIYKRRHQFGATIWNFAYDSIRKTLYTVGSTGNVLSFGLMDFLQNPQQHVVFDTVPSLQNNSEHVARVKFIANDVLIGVTNKDQLIYAEIAENTYKVQNWQEVKNFVSYKFTGMNVSTTLCGTMIALYGFRRLTLYEFDRKTLSFRQCFDGDMLPGVIRAFQFVNAETFLVSDALGNCLLLKGKDFSKRMTVKLPNCKERWLTTALLTPDEQFLLTSNRNGYIMLYQRCVDKLSYELKQTLRHLHGYHGSTILNLLESTDDAFYIRSAGHDGKSNLLCINKSTANLEIYTQHQIPVMWVEAIHTVESDVDGGKKKELVIGFNDNHFVAWSLEDDFLIQLQCGGSHRCWHYSLKQDEATGTYHIQLVFIKQKQVMHKRMRLFNECLSKLMLPTRNFWHVRPCTALAVRSDVVDGKPIIISAGDDNLVKVFTLSSMDQLQLLHELHTHISSVRCVCVLNVHDREYLIFSGGGRAQLCISKLNMRTGHIQEISNYTLNDLEGKIVNNTDNHEDVDSSDDEDKQSYKFNAETRIMTLDVVPQKCAGDRENASGEVYLIYLGCSNGFLVLLEWQPAVRPNTAEKYKTLCNVNFDRCLLQVRLVADLVLVACTDGVLHFYHSDLSLNCFSYKLHKSGINALDVELLKNGNDEEKILEVLTGGDDGAVCCTQFKLFEISDVTKAKVQFNKKHNFDNLHCAQVTAAAFYWKSTVNPPELIALTSSVDQIVIENNITTQGQKRIFRSCVADIKGLCVSLVKAKPERCYLYGCGLQIIDL